MIEESKKNKMKENEETCNQNGEIREERKERKIKGEKEWNSVKIESNENQGTEGVKLREEKKEEKREKT